MSKKKNKLKRNKKYLKTVNDFYVFNLHVNKIKEFASICGWKYIKQDFIAKSIVFKKDNIVININPVMLTVTTQMKHPSSGNTQLVRKKVSLNLIKKIFENPRLHTGIGVLYKQE